MLTATFPFISWIAMDSRHRERRKALSHCLPAPWRRSSCLSPLRVSSLPSCFQAALLLQRLSSSVFPPCRCGHVVCAVLRFKRKLISEMCNLSEFMQCVTFRQHDLRTGITYCFTASPSALRLPVPGCDPPPSVTLRILFRSVPPAQQRDQNTSNVTSTLSRAANTTSPGRAPRHRPRAPYHSASTPLAALHAALTTRHCRELRQSSLQPEHIARQSKKRERVTVTVLATCLTASHLLSTSKKSTPSGARASASLRLYSSAHALPRALRAEARTTMPVSTWWDSVFCTVASHVVWTPSPASLSTTQDTRAIGNDVYLAAECGFD